ncbi:hypothetical protein D3C78_1814720 [compost metagenome]
MELRKTQTLRVFDNHQAGVGYVYAHFNYRGGNQQMQLTLFEGLHHRLFVCWLHAAMHQSDVQLREGQL